MRIAALTSILVFALGAAFAGTAAWFSAITAVDQGGNSFPVKPMSGKFESMTVYPLNTVASDLSKMVFDVSETSYVERATVTDWDSKTVAYSKKKEFQMGTYDLLWPTHPILLVIHFGEIVTPSAGEPLQIQGESIVNEYLGSVNSLTGHDTIKVDRGLSKDSFFPLSSAVETFSRSYGDGQFEASIINNQVTYTYEEREGEDFQKSAFVSFTFEEGRAKDPVFQQKPTFFSATEGSIQDVAIILDYYSTAIEFVFSNFLGIEEMAFACDWTTVVK